MESASLPEGRAGREQLFGKSSVLERSPEPMPPVMRTPVASGTVGASVVVVVVKVVVVVMVVVVAAVDVVTTPPEH